MKKLLVIVSLAFVFSTPALAHHRRIVVPVTPPDAMTEAFNDWVLVQEAQIRAAKRAFASYHANWQLEQDKQALQPFLKDWGGAK